MNDQIPGCECTAAWEPDARWHRLGCPLRQQADIAAVLDHANGELRRLYAIERDARALVEKLTKPDPWMHGDDYGEGYTDGKGAAARQLLAVLNTTSEGRE